MKNFFDLKLKGSQIFKPVLLCWIIVLVLMAIYGSIVGPSKMDAYASGMSVLTFILSFVFPAIMVGVIYVIYYFVIKKTISGISYNGEQLTTYFVLKDYLLMVLKGVLLTIITLGIYSPWFTAKIFKYFASNTTFRDKEFRFKGNGGTLFGIMVLYVVLPVFVSIFIYMVVIAGATLGGNTWSVLALLLGVVIISVLFFLIGLYYALVVRWVINFSYAGSKNILVDINARKAAWFLIGQQVLLLLTGGLYYPAYMVRIYRYFANRTILGEAIVEDQFGFTGTNGKFYWPILGQALLSIITFGIYMPWAYAKIMTMFVNHTNIEDVVDQNRLMPNRD